MKNKGFMSYIYIIMFIFIFVVIFFSFNCTAKTINVTKGGSGDYEKIQDAIDNSAYGDTILVKNGTYNEKITINKKLNIYGEGSDITIINGTSNEYTVTINDNWTNLSGFKITNSKKNGGINLKSNYNNLTYLVCTNNTVGILIEKYSSNLIRNCYITKNIENGLLLKNSSNNKILNSAIFNNSGNGVKIESNSKENEISHCSISENDFGIYINDSEKNKIHQNQFEKNRVNAYSNQLNFWDNNSIGNYWDDYNGIDENRDGIGDSIYNISGGDNIDSYPIFIGKLPDLFITKSDITFSKQNPKDGEKIKIYFFISNVGTRDANNFIVGLYNDGKLEKTFNASIKGGYKTQFNFDFIGNEGKKEIRIVVDQLNDIEELNETNNEAFNEIIFLKKESKDFPIILFSLFAILIVLISLIFTINLWYFERKEKT